MRVDSGVGFPVPPASKTLLNGNPILKKMWKASFRLPSRGPIGGWIPKEIVTNAQRKKSGKRSNTYCPWWRADDFPENSPAGF